MVAHAGGLPQRYVTPEDAAAGRDLARVPTEAVQSIGSFHVRDCSWLCARSDDPACIQQP